MKKKPKKAEQKRPDRRSRGKNIPIADDTMQLIMRIRLCQTVQQAGVLVGKEEKTYVESSISPGLIAHAMQDRLEELCRASKRIRSVDGLGVNTSARHRESVTAYLNFGRENKGRRPTMEGWLEEFKKLHNEGYRIDMRTFRWIAKTTGLPWTALVQRAG